MGRRRAPDSHGAAAGGREVLVLAAAAAQADGNDAPAATQAAAARRDGQHDFDFEIGTWRTHLKRRLHPLTGSNEWAEYEGTSIVRPVWDGRANLVELDVEGPSGRIEALSLRLYNPESRQWSLNFSNRAGGTLFVPTVGEVRSRPPTARSRP